jgi:hypothetical protein
MVGSGTEGAEVLKVGNNDSATCARTVAICNSAAINRSSPTARVPPAEPYDTNPGRLVVPLRVQVVQRVLQRPLPSTRQHEERTLMPRVARTAASRDLRVVASSPCCGIGASSGQNRVSRSGPGCARRRAIRTRCRRALATLRVRGRRRTIAATTRYLASACVPAPAAQQRSSG